MNSKTNTSRSNGRKRQIEVLVIDDEQIILDAISRICKAENHSVHACLDATDALNHLEKYTYCLILCDLMLSDMGGFRFLEVLSERKIEIPVIMMTGYSTVENAVKSINRGAVDFVPKPFTTDEICSAIKRGFKYSEIKGFSNQGKNEEPGYIPCPAIYFRLGNITWLAHDPRGAVLIGVTDFYLKTITSVVQAKLMNPDEEIIQGYYFARLITDEETVHPLMSPLSGRILEVNNALSNDISLLEKDPYFKGWLYRVIPTDLAYELKNLVSCAVDIDSI